jgi:hypothetical protein
MAQQDTSAAQQPASAGGTDRFLLAIVAGTVLLVAVGILIVFVFGRSAPTPPADPDSPAGVVQLYIQAVRSGETEKARGYLSREAQTRFDSNRSGRYLAPAQDDYRIIVDTVAVTDSSAEVKVTVTRFYARSRPFQSSSSHYDSTVRLIREDGAWKMTQYIEPYALY